MIHVFTTMFHSFAVLHGHQGLEESTPSCFSLQRCSGDVRLLSLATANRRPPVGKTPLEQCAGQRQADLWNT